MGRLKYPVLLSVIVMLFLSMSVSQSSGIEKPKPTEQLLEMGKKVYSERCLICHGEKGNGEGEMAHLLYPRPRDFTLAVFKIRSTPTGSLPLDEDIFKTISEGMAGTAMVPFKDDMSDKERWAVIYFIKTFAERWKEEKPEKPVSIGKPLPKTQELMTIGKKKYEDLKCWECHGEKGKGDGPKSDKLKDDAEMPIFPYDFTLSGRMKGGYKVNEIVRTYLTGMDGTPMPAYEVDIPNKERWALAYYTESLSAGAKAAPKRIGHRVIAQKGNKDQLPNDPIDAAWRDAKAVEIPVQHLWTWIEKKTMEPMHENIRETIRVRALYNDHQIAFLIEWDDPMVNSRLKIEDFTDAVAIQFPLSQKEGKAFFGMGDHKRAVNIWQWRAESQVGATERQDLKTPHSLAHPLYISVAKRTSLIDDLSALQPGTLTLQAKASQQVEGKAVWADGKWRAVFRRALKTGDPEDVEFRIGGRYPVAFAVWDGDHEDRDGRKAVTPWQMLEIGAAR
jgi:DMSO reductase family type II enzyme heme b subunit